MPIDVREEIETDTERRKDRKRLKSKVINVVIMTLNKKFGVGYSESELLGEIGEGDDEYVRNELQEVLKGGGILLSEKDSVDYYYMSKEKFDWWTETTRHWEKKLGK